MNAPDRCCGFGGMFSLSHYPLSRAINDRKVADGLQRHGAPMLVLHPVQLLALAGPPAARPPHRYSPCAASLVLM